jgi:hypothetical protein
MGTTTREKDAQSSCADPSVDEAIQRHDLKDDPRFKQFDTAEIHSPLK